MPTAASDTAIPQGFRFAGVACGIKESRSALDLALIAADRPCVAAGVYTQNRVVAAPVVFDRARTPSDVIQCVVVNSGNANACTGEQGDRNVAETAALVESSCGAPRGSALVLSTGVIGRQLPMDCLRSGVPAAAPRLAATPEAVDAAARAMMTTDSRPKTSSTTLSEGAHLLGLAKGAAMIGPNMATMLAVIVTDAQLTPPRAADFLQVAVEESFNRISVDGHASTNDTVLLLASGVAGPVSEHEFAAALRQTCRDLALEIVDDAEGASHRICIQVSGAVDPAAAEAVARTIAASPLVKTAIHGADPNWGRIVSAAGYAGVPFEPAHARLELNGVAVFEAGSPVAFDEAALSRLIAERRDCLIELRCGSGPGDAEHWTADLTAEYVRLNAEYTT